MTHPRVFAPAFRRDMLGAVAWHDGVLPGLGTDFAEALRLTIGRIADQHAIYQPVHAGICRARLRGFPYGVVLTITQPDIVLIACFHASGDLRPWQARLSWSTSA